MDPSHVLASVVGIFGVVLAISPMLQVSRIVRRQSSDDVSATQLAVAFIGSALWFAYGVSIDNPTIIVSNGVATLVNAVAFSTVLRFRRPGRAAAVRPAFAGEY